MDPPVPVQKVKSENIIRSKIKVMEYNDWETNNEDQAAKGGKIEVNYPKVDADTIEDKLLNLQRAMEHLRKARLLKAGLKISSTGSSNFMQVRRSKPFVLGNRVS